MSASSRAVIAALAVATSAGTAAGAGTQVTLADTGSAPSRLHAELVAQALAAQGFTVTRQSLPTAVAADDALRAGTIDGYLSDTATLLERVLGQRKERDEARLTATLAAQLAPRAQGTIGLTPSDDAPAVACTRRAVRAYRLRGVVGLSRRAPSLVYSATPQHVVRADGLASLRAEFKRVVVRPGLGRFDVIRARRAQCVQSTTADPHSVTLGLITLRDRTRRFSGTPNHQALVASQAYLATAPPTFGATVDQVGRTVTTAALRGLRLEVELRGRDLVTTGRAHLQANAISILP